MLPLAFAGSLRIPSVKHDSVGKRYTEREAPAAAKRQANNVGYLPNNGEVGNGTSGTPPMGHGPVVVDTAAVGGPASNSTDAATNGTETTGTNSTGSASDVGGSMDYAPAAGSNGTGTDSMTGQMLVVSERQYTMEGSQRVEISIKYGMSHVNQTWEVANGVLNAVPSLSTPNGCVTNSSAPYPDVSGSADNSTGSLYGDMGSTDNSTSGGSITSDSFIIMSSTTSGSGPTGTGNSGYMVRRPDTAHPGFTGPKY
ncbi:MAG: hypothetical protein Q9220_006588 [cf. Caloplaca sp. 1 TL-2023]